MHIDGWGDSVMLKQSLATNLGPGGQAVFYLGTLSEMASPHSVCSCVGWLPVPPRRVE